jgi:pyrroloquinoline quinone biosynthesis protein D
MNETAKRERLILDASSKPKLPRFMKLRRDETRDRWILLAPERVMTPDAIAIEILHRCDGEKTIEAISTELAADYQASVETIQADIIELLQDLADKGYLTE